MELLPHWMQFSFAVFVWAGAAAGFIYFLWWSVQRWRKYRDAKQSTFDT